MTMPVAIMMAVFVFIVLMLMRRVGQLEQEVDRLMNCLDDQGEINHTLQQWYTNALGRVDELENKVNSINNNNNPKHLHQWQ